MSASSDPGRLTSLRGIVTAICIEAAAGVAESSERRAIRTKSTSTDIVTSTDLRTEALIIERIRAATPGARILAEEGGFVVAGNGSDTDLEWIVDPLDGTVNFAYGLPVTSVSIAVAIGGRPVAGCVADVMRGEVFSAHRGGGASLDGEPISVGAGTRLDQSLVATGYSYRPEVRTRHGRFIAELLDDVRDVRAFGSAALHLCWLAAGRIDIYVERDIKPWDYAAGSLIAEEAGAAVELPCLENDLLVTAANPVLSRAIAPIIAC